MRTRLVSIGNSRGIRIPKGVLQQCDFSDEIELEVRDGAVVLQPVRAARQGWDQAFSKMREKEDDALLLPELNTPSAWDRKEWKW